MNQDLNIFLLIGQSNMSGRGELQEVAAIKHPHIFMYRDSDWTIAKEPLHQDSYSWIQYHLRRQLKWYRQAIKDHKQLWRGR